MVTPIDFKKRTREQRDEFEEYKRKSFEITDKEKEDSKKEKDKYMKSYLTDKLGLYGIEFIESDDYSDIFHQYIFNTPDLKEFRGPTERLQERYDYLIANENNLEGLYKTVYQLES